MSRLLYIMVFAFLFCADVFALPASRSILEIRLSDNSALVVSLNGRNYNKHGRSITIGDLPKGRHDLKVYEYLEYRKGGGGKAKLLYSGRIKIAAGTVNYCEVDIRSGNMKVKTTDIDNVVPVTANSGTISGDGILSTQQMDELQLLTAEHATDIEKLKLLKSSLKGKKYYTTQVRNIAHWLAFEESKLDFLKWAYNSTIDKAEYGKLEDVFSLEENKDQFKKFVK